MRAMHLEFPDDPACDTLDRQYMLGGSLLVAPVFTHDGTVDFYLPSGRWTHYLTGKVVEGGRWVRETHGFLSLPLYVRQNTLLPIGANDQQTDYDYTDGLTVEVFELQDGTPISQTIYATDGSPVVSINAHRDEQAIAINISGKSKTWSILMRGLPDLKSVSGGSIQQENLGTRILPEPGNYAIRISDLD